MSGNWELRRIYSRPAILRTLGKTFISMTSPKIPSLKLSESSAFLNKKSFTHPNLSTKPLTLRLSTSALTSPPCVKINKNGLSSLNNKMKNCQLTSKIYKRFVQTKATAWGTPLHTLMTSVESLKRKKMIISDRIYTYKNSVNTISPNQKSTKMPLISTLTATDISHSHRTFSTLERITHKHPSD